MKSMLISFAAGLMVGAIYAALRVRSPAPPLVALAGLLGMVWGEQVAQRLLTQKVAVEQTAKPAKAASPVEAEVSSPS
jgi:XapX domain-containing protein